MTMQEDNIYRKKECELCGKFAFEKFIKTKGELDGGFTQIEEWEQSGFGSMVVVFHEIATIKNSRFELKLCPDCARKIDLAVAKQIKEIKENTENGK